MLCVCSVYETPELSPPTTETNGTGLQRPATPSYVNIPAAAGAGGVDHTYETPVTSETGKKYSFVMSYFGSV